ncbi:transposase [Micromonospora aurantiaca (nom. illeg.)]|uniref:transposase n=1 Tax=Micromonospora aurantiaca (nom. illeg.) TaxID=47850 RepID=UPI003F537B32
MCWALIAPLLTPVARATSGAVTVASDTAIFVAILYVTRTGCPWLALPLRASAGSWLLWRRACRCGARLPCRVRRRIPINRRHWPREGER